MTDINERIINNKDLLDEALLELERTIHGFSCYARILAEFAHNGGQQDLLFGGILALHLISDEMSVANSRLRAAIKLSVAPALE